MSTVDVIESSHIFSFTAGQHDDNSVTYQPNEFFWIFVFISSLFFLIYTFLKRKP